MNLRGLSRISLLFVGVFALALVLGATPVPALADNSATALAVQESGLQDRVLQTAQAYQQAAAEVDQIEERISQNEARMAEIEERLPEQRERTAASIKSMYLFQQSSPGLLELVLTSEDFNDFISTIRYIDAIQERNTSEINELVKLEEELVQTKAELSVEHDAAVRKEEEAAAALIQARDARREVQARAMAVAASEAPQRAAAIAIAQESVEKGTKKSAQNAPADTQDNGSEGAQSHEGDSSDDNNNDNGSEDEEATITTRSGNTVKVEVPSNPDVSTDPIVDNTSSSEVDSWAARIDAYLAGSPLEGYGSVFAQAASDYGVDPRLSPAISCVESGKGSVCFQPHNAWGWGTSGWSDWESAIRGHVAGFASGYGSSLTLEGAEMYASNDIYAEWYSTVLSEMDSI